MENLKKVLVAIYITASVLIITANLFIISIILYSPILRQRCRNLVIISIALADLLMGCFVIPMVITSMIGSTPGDCHTHLAVQVIGDHGIFFIVGWELITFNLLQIKKINVRFPWKCLRLPVPTYLKTITLVSWPWLATLFIMVPLVVTTTPVEAFNLSEDVLCIMVLPQPVLLTLCFLSIYLPFYLCVAALVTVVVCYSKGCHREQTTTLMEDVNPNHSEENREPPHVSQKNPLAAAVPNTVYLVCTMPLIVHTWLHLSVISTPNSIYVMTVFGLFIRTIILPMSWLIFKDIRHEIRESYSRLKIALSFSVSNPPPSTSSSVSFSRLQETQTM